MDLFLFRSGDVILVGNVQNYAFVDGDVQRPFRFELSNDIKTLADLARVSGAKPIVTNAIVKVMVKIINLMSVLIIKCNFQKFYLEREMR